MEIRRVKGYDGGNHLVSDVIQYRERVGEKWADVEVINTRTYVANAPTPGPNRLKGGGASLLRVADPLPCVARLLGRRQWVVPRLNRHLPWVRHFAATGASFNVFAGFRGAFARLLQFFRHWGAS